MPQINCTQCLWPLWKKNRSTFLWALDLEKVWKPGGVYTNVGTPWRLEERGRLLRDSFRLDVPSWSNCKKQWNDLGTWWGVTRKEETHGMVSAIRWQKTSGLLRWKLFFLRNSSDTANYKGHGWIRDRSWERKLFSTRKEEVRLHPSWVKCRNLEKTEMILWMLEDSDSGKEILLKEREKFHLHWQRKRNKKRLKRCKIIRTNENTENFKSVLELHQYKDCWANLGRWPQLQNQGHSNSTTKGSDVKGTCGKGGGKEGKSEDAEALV